MGIGSATSRIRVVLGDWGGSRLRLWLRDNGATTAFHEAPGFLGARDDPAQVLRAATVSLGVEETDCRIVLCGMAGARGGLGESGYVACPAGADEWVAGALETSLDRHRVTILPGFACRDRSGRPDVMRGEETQVFGALALHRSEGDHPQVLVLPGTHSKWVSVEGDRIAHFATCPTGELYARLLGSSLAPESGADGVDGGAEAFAWGIARAREGAGGLMASLFEARAARMLDGRTEEWASGFLSGLLIGSEIAAMARQIEKGVTPLLVGSAELVSLYRLAFAQFGLDCRTGEGESCALRGLEIAHAATG